MTLEEVNERLRRYEGTDLYDGMETYLLSLVPETTGDMKIRMLKWERENVAEDLKDLEFRY